MPRRRLPRYVLSTELDGKTVFLQELKRKAMVTTTFHTPHIGMAKFFTKYMADKMRLELSDNIRQYQAEPLHLN